MENPPRTDNPPQDDVRSAMARLARRAAAQPDRAFTGWALDAYQHDQGLDRVALAAWLAVDALTLDRLAVCRRPVRSMPDYRAQVEDMAHYFGLSAEKLARLLRRAETLDALDGVAAPSQAINGILMAARDRDETDDGDGDL